MRLRLLYQRMSVLVLGLTAVSILAAPPAAARKPSQLTGQCAVIPNPLSNDVDGEYTVVGSGFRYGQTIDIFVVGPDGATTIFMRSADRAGNFAAVGWAPFLIADGRWSVYVYQAGDRRMTVLASCSFEVT